MGRIKLRKTTMPLIDFYWMQDTLPKLQAVKGELLLLKLLVVH